MQFLKTLSNVNIINLTGVGDLLTLDKFGSLTWLGVGADGDVLTADSTQTTGIKWATPSQDGLVTDANNEAGSSNPAGFGPAGVYHSKSGSILNFYSLACSNSRLQLLYDTPGRKLNLNPLCVQGLVNDGTNSILNGGLSGWVQHTKGLLTGTNCTITDTGNDLRIDIPTGGGGVSSISSSGVGTSLVKSSTGVLKGIAAGPGTSFNATSDVVTITGSSSLYSFIEDLSGALVPLTTAPTWTNMFSIQKPFNTTYTYKISIQATFGNLGNDATTGQVYMRVHDSDNNIQIGNIAYGTIPNVLTGLSEFTSIPILTIYNPPSMGNFHIEVQAYCNVASGAASDIQCTYVAMTIEQYYSTW